MHRPEKHQPSVFSEIGKPRPNHLSVTIATAVILLLALIAIAAFSPGRFP